MTQADLTLPTAPRLHFAAWLTVERAAYGGVTLAALGLRLYDLAARPLTPAEAAQALPAWQSATGRAFDAVGASPLLFQLQRLLFVPFGGGDALPRWPLALLGGLAPLLFFALRDRLGRGGALLAALLWAFSPLAVFVGRLGLDYGLVPPLSLAFLAALNLYWREHDGRWLTWAAPALGLLLIAGPEAYTVVVMALLAALLWPRAAAELAAGVRSHGRTVALALLFTLALAATGLFTMPAGLAMATDLLGRWLRNLLPGGAAAAAALPGGYALPAAYPAWDLARRLLIGEPLLLGAAVVAAVTAWRRADGFGLLASLAALVALLAALVGPGRHPGDLGLVVLPLALLAGPALARILAVLGEWRDNLDGWLLFGLSLALLVSVAIALPAAFSPLVRAEDRRIGVAVAVVAGALCIVLWLTYYWFGQAGLARRVLPAVWLVVAGCWGVGQLVGFNYQDEPGKYNGILVQEAGTGWPVLRHELSALSGVYGTGRHEAAIDLLVSAGPRPASAPAGATAGGIATRSDPQVPMLLWELKDWEHLRFVEGALPANPAPIIVTPVLPGSVPGDVAGVPAAYSGMQVDLLASWRPDENLAGAGDWLQWIATRQAAAPAAERQTVLWINRSAMQLPAATTGFPPLAPGVPAAPPAQGNGAQ